MVAASTQSLGKIKALLSHGTDIANGQGLCFKELKAEGKKKAF